MPAGERRSRPHPRTRPSSRPEEPPAAAAASPPSSAQLRQWQEAESLLDELYAPGLEAALGNGPEKDRSAEGAESPGSPPEAAAEILPLSELASAVSAEELAASPPPAAEPPTQPPPAKWSPQAEELDPLQTEIQDLMGTSFRPVPSPAAPETALSPPAQEPATWSQGRSAAGADRLAASGSQPLSAPAPSTGPEELETARLPSEMPPAAFALEEEIRQLYAALTQEMSARQGLTGHALSLLREARTIVLTQPERLARAQSNVHQVRSLLEAAQAERRRSRRAGMTLLLYLGAVLALSGAMLGFLYTQADPVTRFSQAFWGEGSRLALYTLPFLGAFWAGGAGASLSALRSLLGDLRIGQLFDGRLTLRYLLQPVMGFVLAVLTFLTVAFTLNSLAIPWVTHRWLPFLPPVLAFLAGYGQLLVYGLLFQFLRFLTFRPRRRRGPG